MRSTGGCGAVIVCRNGGLWWVGNVVGGTAMGVGKRRFQKGTMGGMRGMGHPPVSRQLVVVGGKERETYHLAVGQPGPTASA